MARPTKQGIDYFPIDVDFDDKIEMYLLEKESLGLAVLVTLWQLIYKNEGYYIHNGNDLLLMIKKRISGDINSIKECINLSLDRNIFDKNLYEKHKILTSRGIQKRFFDAANKKKEVKYNPKFMLIDVSDYENLIKVDINSIDSAGNATKEKEEVKEKEKEKEDIIFNSWNSFADKNNLAKILKLTDVRKSGIKSRLKEKEFNFEKIIEMAGNAPFLLGSNKQNWKIDFDWIITSKNNYLKILEGKYGTAEQSTEIEKQFSELFTDSQ